MTPRALLTVIGATAIGFAIAISSVAGFTSDAATPSSMTNGDGQAMSTVAFIDAGTSMASGMGTGTFPRSLSGEDDCPIAL